MILCVTGPMAAGKNLAERILGKKGFVTTDADLMVHQAIENARDSIFKKFGALAEEEGISIRNEDGTVNRRNLGALIFKSPELLKAQEALVYPELNSMLDSFLHEHEGQDTAINATVLYKIPVMRKADFVLYIDAPSAVRYLRSRRRDGMSARNTLARFRAQRNLFAKYKNAGADIRKVWNIGSAEALERKIDGFLQWCRSVNERRG